MTFERFFSYYKSEKEPKLKAGENALIVAHGNSLRSLMMYLENISPKDIEKINIPTGLPRKYTFTKDLKIENIVYL